MLYSHPCLRVNLGKLAGWNYFIVAAAELTPEACGQRPRLLHALGFDTTVIEISQVINMV